MRIVLNTGILLFLCLILLSSPKMVQAIPPLPSSFYGTMKLDNQNPPEGTPIQAIINDQVYATTASEIYQGNAVYQLIIPGDDPSTTAVEGGREGDIVYFKIDGQLSDQTGTWESGVNTNLDLTATTQGLEPSATQTRTPSMTPTSIPTTKSTITPQPTLTQAIPTKTTPPSKVAYPAPTQTLAASTQTLTAPPPEAENQDDTALPTSKIGSTLAPEDINPPQDQGGSAPTEAQSEIFEAKPSINENTPEPGEPEKSITWLHIGIPVLLLVCLGVGVFYFQHRSKPDGPLL